MEARRPPVSRETRLLLTVVVAALGMLWVLARIRFPDRPPSSNPVPPVLAQLSPRPVFDDLAAALVEIRPRIQASLVVLAKPGESASDPEAARRSAVALRWRDNLGITLADPAGIANEPETSDDQLVVARDPATTLAIVRVSDQAVPPLATWVPRRVENPRYLIAADPLSDTVALRPVFVAALSSFESPHWMGTVLAVPSSTPIDDGTFAFTTDGALAGAVVEHGDGRLLVPPDLLFQAASRLMTQQRVPRGWIGIDVTPLTPEMAAALGATSGVAVAWVDPDGPAARLLQIADVIERIDGTPSTSAAAWRAREARVAQGEVVTLTVRRDTDVRDVTITAAPLVEREEDRPLGLELRTIQRVGAEVLHVDPGSAAARAGLRAGDVVTMAGTRMAPTAGEVVRRFAETSRGRPLVIAVTRGDAHLLLVLGRTP
jgi:hypothetical protein